MFFVKSFKASDLYRGTVWWIDATYTKLKSIASKYISALKPSALEDFDQGVTVRFKTRSALLDANSPK